MPHNTKLNPMFLIKHKMAMRFLNEDRMTATGYTWERFPDLNPIICFPTAREAFDFIDSRNVTQSIPQQVVKNKIGVKHIFYAVIDRNEDILTCIPLNMERADPDYLSVKEVIEDFIKI